MNKLKKNLRTWLVPILALAGALWLWRAYGNPDVWWWPLAIAVILAAALTSPAVDGVVALPPGSGPHQRNRRDGLAELAAGLRSFCSCLPFLCEPGCFRVRV